MSSFARKGKYAFVGEARRRLFRVEVLRISSFTRAISRHSLRPNRRRETGFCFDSDLHRLFDTESSMYKATAIEKSYPSPI